MSVTDYPKGISDTEACGTVSFLLWGGEPALRWSERWINQQENK